MRLTGTFTVDLDIDALAVMIATAINTSILQMATQAQPLPKVTSKMTYTVKQAATEIGVSPRTIARLIDVKRLKAMHIGRRVVITQAAIDTFLKGK